ncbi:hypothetical protein [Falsiroseomonas oryziterrae]|uniref:hypothetical protein n=1 Tax=Falsiroseomonas oryziterrae TaxID=2911368 RepID=UPI001F39FA83|nr:hypothetical protein [Roseomonas sp. NPKOSM-4]
MRRTLMVSDKSSLTIQTGDAGTEVLDAGGVVLATHGTDRHDELVAAHEAEGWRVARSGDVRPEEAADVSPPPSGPAGPAGEVDLGNAG